MKLHALRCAALVAAVALAPAAGPLRSIEKTAIEQFLGPPYPYALVSAARAERIAWIAYEKGMRNVYTAAGPAFRPVRLTAHLADDGVDLTDLAISDDGSTVVFVRGHAPNRDGWVANPTSDPRGAERAVWGMRTTGGRPWKIAVAGSPQLSPEGRRIVWARDGQIYGARVHPARAPAEPGPSAEPQPLFRAFGSNSNPVWSPDSRRIAFVSARGDHSFIGVYDLESPKVTYLAPGVDHDTSPAWSHDGKRIAFLRRPGTPFGAQILARQSATGAFPGRGPLRGRSRRGDPTGDTPPPADGLNRAAFAGGHTLSVRVADAAGGEAREIWHNAPGDAEFAAVARIQWAGDHLVFLAERKNWEHYYALRVDGRQAEPVELTPGEGFVEQAALSPDGKLLFAATNIGDIDRRHIWKVPVDGSEKVALTSGDGIETYPAPLASGRVAVLAAGWKQPLSVAVVASGTPPKVLFPRPGPDFPAAEHVVPCNVRLRAEDGLEFHNQLFLPAGGAAAGRRPAMIFVHGGPQRQMLLGYHYRHFYHMAYAVNQYLASRGYVVLSINYRSGIGYGRDFRRAPRTGSRGNAEYQDVLAAGKYLQARPDVDPQRIGIWGLSYGGILTAQALARNSDIFAAGCDMAGIHLWGSSIDKNEVSFQSSSIASIDAWRSPVLLIHGDDDRNVAFSQTTGLVQLLRARNIPHELVVFPDDVHDSLLFKRWLIAFGAMDRFFGRFLQRE